MKYWFGFRTLVVTLLGVLGLHVGQGLALELLQTAQPITGTRVRIIPPTHFRPATQFPGYVQEETQASILVSEIPGAFAELSAGLSNPDALKQRGLTLIAQEVVMVNSQSGLLLKLKQTAYGIEFTKWLLLLGNDQESVLITATFPTTASADLEGPTKQSLLTTQWHLQQTVSPTEGLAYRVVEQGDLKIARRLSNGLLYTLDGRFPARSANEPIFLITPSLSPAIADPKTFSQKYLLAIATLTEVNIASTTPVTIDQLQGYEIRAQARDRRSGQAVAVYHVVLFDEEAYYYVLHGEVGVDQSAEYMPIFEAIAKSFQRLNLEG